MLADRRSRENIPERGNRLDIIEREPGVFLILRGKTAGVHEYPVGGRRSVGRKRPKAPTGVNVAVDRIAGFDQTIEGSITEGWTSRIG